MTTTANRRRKVEMPGSLTRKLVGALSMLIIAAIMLVSSTFAWFTLSTAPEVKGITTSIGSNGNLEMMLLTKDSFMSNADDLGVLSNLGDSMDASGQTVEEANVTWGNLVDLGEASYGLSAISLSPAALNLYLAAVNHAAASTKIDVTGNKPLLYVPTYGSDGRVDTVSVATSTGPSTGAGMFISNADYNGARGIGVASAMSVRTQAYREAIINVNSAVNGAKTTLTNSLNASGPALGELMIKFMADSEDQVSVKKYEKTEFAALGDIITALEQANDDQFDAIRNAALAYVLSNLNTAELDDAAVVAIKNKALALDAATANATTISGLAADPEVNVTLPESINTAYTDYLATKANIAVARGDFDTLYTSADTLFSQSQIRGVMNKILDKTHASVGGVVNPGRDDAGTIILNTPIPIVLLEGTGLFYDVAKSVGNIGPITGEMHDLNVGGIGVARVPFTMSTAASSPFYVLAVQEAVSGKAPEGDASGNTALTPSAFALDLGFRTNADNAGLRLSSEAIQRIYTDSTNAATQGAGTYVEFNSVDTAKFSVDKVKALMDCVRIIFAEPKFDDSGNLTEYTVLKVAKPDVAAGAAAGTTGWRTPIAFYSYTAILPKAGEAPILTVGDKLEDTTLEITRLTKNVAKKLTVIVYLDGDAVDNGMVANAASSMTGSLNLQFKTDAELVPMEDANLRNGTVTYTAITGHDTEIATALGALGISTSATVYAGTDGNYYYSTDGGSTYTAFTAEQKAAILTAIGG